jgi:outer membrane protein assembly factor BamE (lipoprotein component of BamABCDE complex)
MLRINSILALALISSGIASCAPTNSYQGFQAIEAAPSDVKVGTDSRSTVLAKLGSPTEVSTFDKNTWFYISQISNRVGFYKPRVSRRDVVAIAFDQGSQEVVAVNTFSLKDGRVIAFNNRETPTRGREMTVLEQLLGSLSAASALPPEDPTPGSHPGDQH